MARYSGTIAYAIRKEDPAHPGVFVDIVEEKTVYGDILNNVSKEGSANKVNKDIVLNVSLSIVADAFAMSNFQHIKYATYMGAKWEVLSANVQRPRLILSLGGVYNE